MECFGMFSERLECIRALWNASERFGTLWEKGFRARGAHCEIVDVPCSCKQFSCSLTIRVSHTEGRLLMWKFDWRSNFLTFGNFWLTFGVTFGLLATFG